MKFKVTAASLVADGYSFIGTVEADTYEDAWIAAYGIVMEGGTNCEPDSVVLYADADNAQPIVDKWVEEAMEEFHERTGIQISANILYDQLSDYSEHFMDNNPEDDEDDTEYFHLDNLHDTLEHILNEEVESELEEQETSERFFTDGDTLLDMDGMRYQFEEAKKLGETEATRLAEYIDEWLTDFFSTREISEEEFIELRDRNLPTWLPEGNAQITTTYAEDSGMTFILRETYNAYHEPISTEVVGFYYGRPDEDMTREYIGQLKAEY